MKNKILTLACICLLAGCSTGSKDKEIARLPLDLYMEVEITDAHTLRVEMDNQSGYTMDFPKMPKVRFRKEHLSVRKPHWKTLKR